MNSGSGEGAEGGVFCEVREEKIGEWGGMSFGDDGGGEGGGGQQVPRLRRIIRYRE
jgi:hypothetical protein